MFIAETGVKSHTVVTQGDYYEFGEAYFIFFGIFGNNQFIYFQF